MSAAPPVAAPVEAKGVADASRGVPYCLRLAGLAIVIWIIALAIITWNTANPEVVNRAQIMESDFVFVGRFENESSGRFQVERELKHGELQGPVTVQDLPQHVPSTNTWVVPVLRHGKSYVVTQGAFPLPAEKGNPPENAPWEIHVPVKVYPATEDVLRQIDRMLNELASKK